MVGALALSWSCAWMYLDVQHDRKKAQLLESDAKTGFIGKVVAKICKRDDDYFSIVTDNADTVILTENQYNQVEIGKTYFFEGSVKYQPSIRVDTISLFNGTEL